MNKLSFKRWKIVDFEVHGMDGAIDSIKCLACKFLNISINHKQTHMKSSCLLKGFLNLKTQKKK